jgi:O-antigen ligase
MNMKALFTRYLNLSSAEQAAWFLVWVSLPFSLKMSSASIILASLVIFAGFVRRPFVPARRKVLYLLLPVIFFFWHARELLGNHPFFPVWKETEHMLSFLVIPCIFTLSRIRKEHFTRIAMTGLVPALVISGCIMLGAAGIRFAHSGEWSEFTYHTLARPIHLGAIYFSFYLLFALFKLDDPAWMAHRPGMKLAIAMFFLFLLLLSASKLFIGLGLPLLVWHERRLVGHLWRNNRKMLAGIFILVFLGTAPFVERAKLLARPNFEMVSSADFKTCPEPNGVNLRLIFLRFGLEILDDQHAWLTGTGMTGSQALLNQKFHQYGLYTGTGDGKDTGYLNYNFHDQFMETLVKTGIPGLVILIAILVIFAIQRSENLFAPTVFVWLVAGFFLTESVLERQAGIVLFCLVFSAFFIMDNRVSASNER